MDTTSPLMELGELYRDDQGHEVWRIRDRDGNVFIDGVANDDEAAEYAEQIW